MKSAPSFISAPSRILTHSALFTICILMTLTTGCGSGSSSSGGQKLSGDTAVTVMLSSTANDQLASFDFVVKTLTLTGQSGNTVTLITGDEFGEAIHLNGKAEPFASTVIPQDVYTSATATIGNAQFTCIEVIPPGYDTSGDLDTSTYAYGYVPDANVTVTLPSPVTITGDHMALVLNMLVSQSESFESCYPSNTYAITPTFSLAAMDIAAQSTNTANGKITGYYGQITSLNSTTLSFTPSATWGPVPEIPIIVNSTTAYVGVSAFSDLQVGEFVDVDASLQVDGSLMATRVAVPDLTAVNAMTGPLLLLNSASFYTYGRQQQGQQYTPQPATLGIYSFSETTSFQVSSQMSNVASLPFAPTFSGSNMVPGQNMSVFSGPLTAYYGGETNDATTITLLPQTVNGTILNSTASSNGFTDFTIEMAAYDLFPDLASQQGQPSRLINPSIMEVYIDANTQKINTQALAAGNTLRFYGLVFNDNGTLRMDCAQVSDGVPFSPTPNANIGTGGITKSTLQTTPTGAALVNTTVAQPH